MSSPETWASLYSQESKQFHVEELSRTASKNRRIIQRGAHCEWVLIGLSETEEEACRLCDTAKEEFEKTSNSDCECFICHETREKSSLGTALCLRCEGVLGKTNPDLLDALRVAVNRYAITSTVLGNIMEEILDKTNKKVVVN